jgi:predicted acyltransferase
MPVHVGGLAQSVSGTCSNHVASIQDLLLASLPEFVGGLSVALVTAVVAWSVRKRYRRNESDENMANQGM